jgi:hypothetical protein
VEFVRYSGPDLYMYDVESGSEIVEPAEPLAVETVSPGRWRILRDGKILLEVTTPPADFQQRTFDPPTGYPLMTRLIRPRVPWPDPPQLMSIEELVNLRSGAGEHPDRG